MTKSSPDEKKSTKKTKRETTAVQEQTDKQTANDTSDVKPEALKLKGDHPDYVYVDANGVDYSNFQDILDGPGDIGILKCFHSNLVFNVIF